ncbi:MAG: flagellar basal body P-ring protein FlgI [Desulfobacteraceae bacterium]|nr:MAG: flagellar basal body P-ring protein FlgI [Desulfobacteraceae bacterium]
MSGRFKIIFLSMLMLSLLFPSMVMSARIKDLVSIKGIRTNQLFGYGLVIGLNGSGDKDGTGFTIQALANMMEKMGIRVNPQDVKVSNVAAVMVNAELPPFARTGKKIDVMISSIGDAKSLQGGTLLLTPLKGVDGRVYALAHGPVVVGGYGTGGDAGGGVTKNHPTVGRISNGASVEKEVLLSLEDKKELILMLENPDFVTATRVAEAIKAHFGEDIASPVDSGTLKIRVPEVFQNDVVRLVAQLGNLDVTPDVVARVIVNEKTGTVVIGENVRLSVVAVAHGNLNIQIKENKDVSQPMPFGVSRSVENSIPIKTANGTVVAPGGATVVTPDTEIDVKEEKARLLLLESGRTVGELVKALNAIGVTPRDLITILQTIKAAGALQAELEII